MKIYFPVLVFIALISACSKDNMEVESPAIPYKKIGEGYTAGTKVELYAKNVLTTGYNPLYIALYDSVSKQPIENAEISLLPVMDMGTMQHSSPVENPSTAATNKLFNGAVVFTMPSGDMGAWTLDINLLVGEKKGKLTLPLNIGTSSRLKSFVSKADNAKFIIAYILPDAPKAGVNDLEIAIYRSKSMMEFPADSSLTVTLTPEMPTMGHGSPNNQNPVHLSSGHYKGKVNFTMTGLWYLHLDFHVGAAVADSSTFFEVNF